MIETRDLDLLERVLRREAVWAGYALGDLDEPYFSRTRWFLSDPKGTSLVMVYHHGHSTVMTFGAPEGVAALVSGIELPESFHIHYPATHREALAPLIVGDCVPHLRLGLRAGELREVATPPGATVAKLTASDVPAALELYAHYPDNWFDARRVDEGCYVGVRLEGQLVAVGGTHVYSPGKGAAGLGDIVTDPAHRGKGLGTFVTHALCVALVGTDLIVLNVKTDNAPALRVYEKIGFRSPVLHDEGCPVRRAD